MAGINGQLGRVPRAVTSRAADSVRGLAARPTSTTDEDAEDARWMGNVEGLGRARPRGWR